jgi:hypothetical protein
MHEIELKCDIRTVQYDILQADSGCNEAVALQDGGLNSGTSVEAELLRKLLRRQAIIPRAPGLGSTRPKLQQASGNG